MLTLIFLVGVCAQEVHVCGEASAVSIIKELAMSTGDQVEVRTYKRLTTLSVLNHAVGKNLLAELLFHIVG